ncbi:MAG: thiamine pyridinylase [Pseudodesulfovibrio sp.]
MPNMKRLSLSIIIITGLFLLISACASQTTTVGNTAQTLTVGLYPDVPRIDQFKAAIEAEWAKVEPNVSIIWDDSWGGGYSEDPASTLDIYVFDTLYLSYFQDQKLLYNIPMSQVDDFDDFLEYAKTGVNNGDTVLGIPQLGCTTVLFHRTDDTPMAEAVTLDDVVKALNTCTYYPEAPPASVGLMADFSNESANAGYYIQSLQCDEAKWPVVLPWDESEIDQNIIDYIKQVIAMSSFKNALYDAPISYQRGTWFGENKGRAYIGYSESVSTIPEDQYDTISVKVMPWANNTSGIAAPLFYSDVIGVHTATEGRGTTDLAIKLANVMASADTLVAALGPYQGDGPQYLIPARNSAFQTLSDSYPMYQKIYTMVQDTTPIMFDAGTQARAWFNDMATSLTINYKADPPCYTDVPAVGGFIGDNEQAQTICPETCTDYNGWSGQWTNTVTPSVCGCETPSQ